MTRPDQRRFLAELIGPPGELYLRVRVKGCHHMFPLPPPEAVALLRRLTPLEEAGDAAGVAWEIHKEALRRLGYTLYG